MLHISQYVYHLTLCSVCFAHLQSPVRLIHKAAQSSKAMVSLKLYIYFQFPFCFFFYFIVKSTYVARLIASVGVLSLVISHYDNTMYSYMCVPSHVHLLLGTCKRIKSVITQDQNLLKKLRSWLFTVSCQSFDKIRSNHVAKPVRSYIHAGLLLKKMTC